MLGPLNFPEKSIDQKPSSSESSEVICILCTHQYPSHNELLTHLFVEHKMVIADVPLIADLSFYLDYWRIRLCQPGITLPYVCTTMLMNGENYYLLSDVLPEDKLLREGIHMKKLKKALAQQELERSDTTYSVLCMFCRHEITPTRASYITHLADHHNVQLGPPDNLVYVDKLLQLVEDQVNNLKCLFCERTYKSRDVLKEHMRKKGHKRLNPQNDVYDQFYISNYSEVNNAAKRKNVRPINPSETDASEPEEDETATDWSDWTEESPGSIVCLFCEEYCPGWDLVLQHMISQHQFDFIEQVKGLDFYQQVKLVNYIRREIYWNTCPYCNLKFSSSTELRHHMNQEKHMKIPKESLWNCPEYFFPTYENDGFLCQLDDGADEEDVVDKTQNPPTLTTLDLELFANLKLENDSTLFKQK